MVIHVLWYVSRHLCVSCVWNSYYNSTSAESISKFGSGLFLLVQVVLLLDFVHGWNENWVAKDEQFWLVACCCYFLYLLGLPLVFFFVLFILFCRCRYMALLVVSVVCYIATFCFSGLLFHWFTPSGHDCGLNLFFIVFTLILVFGFAIVALHPKVPSCSLFFSVLLILPLFILLDLTRNRCLISYTGWVWGLEQYYTCNSRFFGWFDCFRFHLGHRMTMLSKNYVYTFPLNVTIFFVLNNAEF